MLRVDDAGYSRASCSTKSGPDHSTREVDIDSMDVIPREKTPPQDDYARKENAMVACTSEGQPQQFLVLRTVVIISEIFLVLA